MAFEFQFAIFLFEGTRPTYWKQFDESIPWKQRSEEIVQWIMLPEEERFVKMNSL